MAEIELNTTSLRTDGSISGEAMQSRSISSLPAGFSMAYPVMFHPGFYNPDAKLERSDKKEDSTTELQKRDEEKACTWPQGLIADELTGLAELGLGKAIDVTQKCPWSHKKPYQARKVEQENLIVTNEGNRYDSFSEYVETHYEVQGAIEAAVKVPNKPIETSVAADLNRSQTTTKQISGEHITTRTISFDMNILAPRSTTSSPTTLEENLHAWVENAHGNMRKSEETCATETRPSESTFKYPSDTNAYCRDFIVDVLGGATHYVSSITLGAMKYSTRTISNTVTRSMHHGAVSTTQGGSAKTSLSLFRKVQRKRENKEEIGIFPGEGEKHLVELRTPAEAVIRYAVMPITALVSNPDLRKYLHQSIQQYIESFKRRGPYHIMSEPTTSGRPVYWKLSCQCREKEDTKYSYRITGTTDERKASNFYIRPVDPTDPSRSRFYITTDPEDRRHFDSKSKDTEDERPIDKEAEAMSEDIQDERPNDADVDSRSPEDVERYLHIKENRSRSSFEIVPCSLVNKEKAQLMLMDRIEGKKVKFLNSKWLPRTLCGSSIPGEPYFICPVSYSTWHHKSCITMVKPESAKTQRGEQEKDQQSPTNKYITEMKKMSEEQESPNHLMLFMLTAGHST